MLKRIIALSLALLLILSGCTPSSQPTAEPTTPPAPAEPATEPTTPPSAPAESATEPTTPPSAPAETMDFVPNTQKPVGFEDSTWADVVEQARNTTVNLYQWGGSEVINSWITNYVAAELKQQYDITLNLVPVTDLVETVNKVLGEKQAGKDKDGSVDLMWINGENFRTMREANLLYGPWSRAIPSSRYVNWEDPSIAFDFGYEVGGYEAPYGKAQFVMVYDSAKISQPPKSIPELLEWAKANPGKFTYPAPPDFTGSVFVRHVCYSASGGYEQFMGDFNSTLFEEKFPDCWKALNEVEPYLWRSGDTYPESSTRMQDLFANGEIYFDMTYTPAGPSGLVAQGIYPETTRTFVFDEGTIANTNYLAITFNSSNKAGAMVAANFMTSPEAQFSKADPTGWGDLTPLDMTLLPQEWQEKFAGLPRGVATLPAETLAAHRLPELQAAWLTAIEAAWETYVLHDQ